MIWTHWVRGRGMYHVDSTYFAFKDRLYKLIEGAPLGPPISPILADLYTESFEANAIETADKKPSLWLCYIDKTFVVWPHGLDSLEKFLTHINSIRIWIDRLCIKRCTMWVGLKAAECSNRRSSSEYFILRTRLGVFRVHYCHKSLTWYISALRVSVWRCHGNELYTFHYIS